MTFPYRIPGLTNGLSTIDGPTLSNMSQDVSRALDGYAGGAYAPSAPIIIGGSGLERVLAAGPVYDTFLAAPSLTRVFMLAMQGAFLGSGWSSNVAGYTGSEVPYIVGSGGAALAHIPLNFLPDGATVTAITMKFTIPTGHTGLPTTQPSCDILTQAFAADVSPTNLASFAMAAGTVAAYENGGAEQSQAFGGLPFTVNRSANSYWLALLDEHGTNSIGGANRYRAIQVTWTLPDMRPQL